jgi:plastocyanin domain-containing protein
MSQKPVLVGALVLGAVASFLPGCKPRPAKGPPGGDGAVHIQVDEKGYTPASITVTKGKPVRLIFRRTSDKGCGSEVVFTSEHFRLPLPLNQDVSVSLKPMGDIAFTCGMGMYKGTLVVGPAS